MGKPLEGIKVVELANYVAGPIAGRILADMGADVIKVEGRGGDAWRNTSASHTQTGWDENPLFDLFNKEWKQQLSLEDLDKYRKTLKDLLKEAEELYQQPKHPQDRYNTGVQVDWCFHI